MTFWERRYQRAVATSDQTRNQGEYVVWRSPAFNDDLRFFVGFGALTLGLLVSVVLLKNSLLAGIWTLCCLFLGIWRILTPVSKAYRGYTVTSGRLIVFQLHRTLFQESQSQYSLEHFHRPVVERNLLFKNRGDLRFDRVTTDPSSWRNSIFVRSFSLLFESVRIRDVKDPEAAARVINEDKTIKWGANA